MNEIQFPYTDYMNNVDLCLLLTFISAFDNTEIIGIDCSDLAKISPKCVSERLEEIVKSYPDISEEEYGCFCVSQFSEIYLVLTCILFPDEVIDFSDYSFKESSEKILLYVKKFKGARLFLSVYQSPEENLVKYQLDCDSRYSAVFLMNIMKQQYIPRLELEDKLYQFFETYPDVQDWVEEGVVCFISMQVFSPKLEKSQTGKRYDVAGLFYIIGFENDISGIFEYMIEKNAFLSEGLTSENTKYAELLAQWLKVRYE